MDVSTTTPSQLPVTKDGKLNLTLANMQINGHLWTVPKYLHIHLEGRGWERTHISTLSLLLSASFFLSLPTPLVTGSPMTLDGFELPHVNSGLEILFSLSQPPKCRNYRPEATLPGFLCLSGKQMYWENKEKENIRDFVGDYSLKDKSPHKQEMQWNFLNIKSRCFSILP